MKINFTYIIPFIQKVFPVKTKKELNNKYNFKKEESKTKDSVCFKDVLEKEIQKVKK